MLGPRARISLNLIVLSFFIIPISKISKDKPSPAARSAKPPKSAKDKSFTNPGAFTILKFSIFKFEIELFLSIIVVNNNLPPIKLLKNCIQIIGVWKSE